MLTDLPRLFQFWHDSVVPQFVADLAATWVRYCPEFGYYMANDDSATEFIRRHFGKRHLNAFRRCAVPAMRADFFRLCALYVHAGVYSDAAQSCKRPIYPLYLACQRGCFFLRVSPRGRIVIPNGFMIIRNRRDPLIGRLLYAALGNIEKKKFLMTFGRLPGPGS